MHSRSVGCPVHACGAIFGQAQAGPRSSSRGTMVCDPRRSRDASLSQSRLNAKFRDWVSHPPLSNAVHDPDDFPLMIIGRLHRENGPPRWGTLANAPIIVYRPAPESLATLHSCQGAYLFGCRPSVSSIYVPYGSVRNAILRSVPGNWRTPASILMPFASRFLTNASRFFTSNPM